MTMGSSNVYVALTERWPWRSWICDGSSEPRPGERLAAFSTLSVTSELISWMTEPASFVTLTVSVNGSPARAVAGDTVATRWKPLEMAFTCVEPPPMAPLETSLTVSWVKPPCARRTSRSARPSESGVSAGSTLFASAGVAATCTTSLTPLTGFHHASVASTVTVNA